MNNSKAAHRNWPARIAAVLLAASAGAALLVTTPAPLAAASPGVAAARCHQHGHHPARVPYVDGMQFRQARKVLRRACLKARAIPRAEGIVAYEVPRAGVHVKRGSAVRLHMAATG